MNQTKIQELTHTQFSHLHLVTDKIHHLDPITTHHLDPVTTHHLDPVTTHHLDPVTTHHLDPVITHHLDPVLTLHLDPVTTHHLDPVTIHRLDPVTSPRLDPMHTLLKDTMFVSLHLCDSIQIIIHHLIAIIKYHPDLKTEVALRLDLRKTLPFIQSPCLDHKIRSHHMINPIMYLIINYNNNKCLGIVRFNTQTIIQSRKTFCARFQPLTGTFKRARTEQLGDRCSVQPCFDHPGPVANPGNILPQINVRDIKGMSLVIDIVVNGHETEAVVDTAANVTLISESFFNSLPCHNTPLGKTVILRGISEHPMEGKLCDGLNIRIGHQTYQWNVCIAPISDNILLGIDS